MFNKIVTYKEQKFYVHCDVSSNLFGTIEFNKTEPINGYYAYKYEGDFSGYGSNLKDIVSNLIKAVYKIDLRNDNKFDEFDAWDGIIE